MTAAAVNAPKTRTDNVKETLHGVELTDPYRWLEDQQAPATRAWIDEQNRYTRSVLDAAAGRESIRKRVSELMRIDEVSTPAYAGGWYFYSRRAADKEKASYYRRRGVNGPEEIILDASKMAEDETFSVLEIAKDGTLLLYGIRKGGKDETSARALDLATGRRLEKDTWPEGRRFGFALTPDKKRLFYATSGNAHPRVFEHRMGTPASEDREIFGNGYGRTHILITTLSEEGGTLLIRVLHGSTGIPTEIFFKDLKTDAPVKPLITGLNAEFEVEMVGGRIYSRTNWKAPNRRIVAIDPARPAPENWATLVPEAKSVADSMTLAGGRILVQYLENVQPRVKIFSTAGAPQGELPLPGAGLGTLGFISGRWERQEIFFNYQSFHIPRSIYRAELGGGAPTVWSAPQVPVRSADFEVRQVWYASKDGTRVPMFLVHKKGLARDGSHPTLLYGYGGFLVTEQPQFQPMTVAWVERGGVYAMPNLRGGGEFGEAWHEAGMGARKQNVFDDFIAAGEYLVKERYTSPSKLAIRGTSNGGLLVGAALTQRPDLFRAVVCRYPLLDMVRYHRFLVARFWVPEYGSSEDASQFGTLRAYSPYHNVKPGTRYPAVMVVTGDGDTRVDPLHGRKMAALLQASTTAAPDHPVLLHYDTKAGHTPGLSVTHTIGTTVDELSFLAWQTGLRFE